MERSGVKPTKLTFWEATHTRGKDRSEWASETARELAERFSKLCEDAGLDLSQPPPADTETQLWVQAQGRGPLSRNRILGEPGVPAYQILGGSWYGHPVQPSQGSNTPGGHDGASGSGSRPEAAAPYDRLRRAARRIVQRIFEEADSIAAGTRPSYERIHTLAQEALAGGALDGVPEPVRRIIMSQNVRMMAGWLDDLFREADTIDDDEETAGGDSDSE